MEITLKNIGKLHNATIRCPGITVIAGENNTGKSTIGRALYLYLNAFYGLDGYVRKDVIETLRRNFADPMEQFDLMCRRFTSSSRRHKLTQAEEIRKVYAIAAADENYDDLMALIAEMGNAHASLYNLHSAEKIKEAYPEQYKNWVSSTRQAIEGVQNINGADIGKRKVSRLVQEIFDGDLISFGQEDEEAKIGVKRGGFQNSLFFTRNKKDGKDYCSDISQNGSVTESAIYLDSPKMVDELYELSRSVKGDLTRYLKQYLSPVKQHDQIDVSESVETASEAEQRAHLLNKFSDAIRTDTNGYLAVNPSVGLEFKQAGQSRSVDVRNLSSGVKSLSLLEYAVGNGVLKKSDYLILDEPEINLHPAWQLEYARLLIMLQQVLDLRIILTTHTPYFLNAVEVFSAKAGIADKVAYFATYGQEDGSAVVRDVSDNVEEIYKHLADPFQKLEDVQYGG